MPFTGSHPAAVVPLLRLGLVPSALVIGSMAPDLPYYAPLPVASTLTHSAAGVIGIDLLMGLAVFALWQGLLAPAVVAVSPTGLRDRLGPGLPVPARQHVASLGAIALLVASLTIGAATHVVWDAFTHADRWGTEHVPWLNQVHGPFEGYRWMQYASGLVGAAVLGVAGARWWARQPCVPGSQRVPAAGVRRSRVVVSIVGACLVLGACVGLSVGLAGSGPRAGVFLAATWGGGAASAAALVCAAAMRLGVQGVQRTGI